MEPQKVWMVVIYLYLVNLDWLGIIRALLMEIITRYSKFNLALAHSATNSATFARQQ
jgi:hypothetical protein